MGRRKERRLAAMASAGGRRVKLDLFRDPSPGETPSKEGERGENHDQQTGVPTSPSSSDKKENPLALLGQYSDDEEDEEAADQPNDEMEGNPADAGAKITHEHGDSAGDEGNAQSDLASSASAQQELTEADETKLTGNISEKNVVALKPTLEDGIATASQAIPDSSGMQIVGDIGGNWKTVMHEQSNRCYYWNTVTGETSWEIPNGLASEIAADSITSASAPTHVDYSMEVQAHALTHNAVEAYPSDMSVLDGSVAYATLGTGQPAHDAYAYAGSVTSHESTDIDPLQLSRYGEDLLQRLKQLERLHGSIYNFELVKREIEIRISDCHALSSYGSSLLPLWLHAEVHLKQLEYSVSKLEASYSTTGPRHPEATDMEQKTPNEAEATLPSKGEDLKSEVCAGAMMDANVKTEEPFPTSCQKSEEIDTAAVPSNIELDDEDMDVEMEVDDENIEEHSSSIPSKEHPPSEQVQSATSLSPEVSAAPPEDSDIPPPPPPPEDEWIPPPPPENEPTPPPPPEEPEPAVQYISTETIPQSYVGQANLGYTVPGMEYYVAAGTEGTNASYYMQTSESHVVQAQQNGYYAPVSASGVSIPVDATSVAPVPVSYYSYPSVTTAATGVAAEPSEYYAASVSATSSSVLDNRTSSSNLAPANNSLQPKETDNIISKEAKIASLSQLVGTTSASGTTSIQGSSTQASTSTTNNSKVIRSKKRAVAASLRSNKKVSSLVDKWKAAKEELRDEEDEEPESALDALERKRQKDIDEWRKQQIASGEAQENANFVPLGGDWRDRVKRRRAEAKKEAKSEPIPAPVSVTDLHRGQPDLAELSKGLPSGWQAYMDESTKQVYYGSSLTSETTWNRPTK
ncbi:formin-binding protein 4 isoform X2 [Oryza brachyantha]|uniref:WW domain-containing protein n=1 Tax=Oryza brachyantha TaxID=4533 RepID=J3MDF8_ORYBR|nr:formin-binding protein 4 isoform X2 [Oryza brachyantha]